MSLGWENFEPAELEFFHSRLRKGFHEYRKSITQDINVEIDGLSFNKIVAKAKLETYEKYKYLGSLGIPKEEFEEKSKTEGRH